MELVKVMVQVALIVIAPAKPRSAAAASKMQGLWLLGSLSFDRPSTQLQFVSVYFNKLHFHKAPCRLNDPSDSAQLLDQFI
jgi:hypothetical protein